jgi:endonuclease III
VARWFVERCGPAKPNATAASVSASSSKPASLPIPTRRRFSEDGQSVDLSPLIGLRGAALEALRQDILAVYGVGPETADSILLYALDGDTFVIDAYTLRIFERHGVFPPDTPYEDAKLVFEAILGRDVDLFNEYHAQIVALGKYFCKTRNPLCDQCPLGAEECFAFGKRLI